jgi:hypothetical protein
MDRFHTYILMTIFENCEVELRYPLMCTCKYINNLFLILITPYEHISGILNCMTSGKVDAIVSLMNNYSLTSDDILGLVRLGIKYGTKEIFEVMFNHKRSIPDKTFYYEYLHLSFTYCRHLDSVMSNPHFDEINEDDIISLIEDFIDNKKIPLESLNYLLKYHPNKDNVMEYIILQAYSREDRELIEDLLNKSSNENFEIGSTYCALICGYIERSDKKGLELCLKYDKLHKHLKQKKFIIFFIMYDFKGIEDIKSTIDNIIKNNKYIK